MTGIEEQRRELVAEAARTPTVSAIERRVRARRGTRRAAVAAVAAVAGLVVAAGDGSAPETEVVLGGAPGTEVVPGSGEAVSPFEVDFTVQFADGVDVIVYLDPEAPASSIDAVRIVLEESEAVHSFRFLDHQASYEEFRELFVADDPDLVESVTPEVMPTAFKIDVVEPLCASIDRIREAVERTEDVREAISPFC